jgi:hypothetical protein
MCYVMVCYDKSIGMQEHAAHSANTAVPCLRISVGRALLKVVEGLRGLQYYQLFIKISARRTEAVPGADQLQHVCTLRDH